jgi:hypothetical protein
MPNIVGYFIAASFPLLKPFSNALPSPSLSATVTHR